MKEQIKMTAVERQEHLRQLQEQFPKALHELANNSLAVHMARSYFYSTGDLEAALIGCIVNLAECNANLMKQLTDGFTLNPPIFIIQKP